MIRAVIDVNVLVSAIIGPLGYSRQVAVAWEAGRFHAISSAGIIAQLEEKLSLPRIVRRYSIDTAVAIRWIQLLLSSQAEFILVPLQERLPITGDPEDDYVLATARLARAEYLITGDKGLL
jgi:putative PIN family toxin of toxin-antitoxin system